MIAIGTPASGSAETSEASIAAASASADSVRTTRKAPMRASTASMWARCARTTSTAVSSPGAHPLGDLHGGQTDDLSSDRDLG